MSNLFYNTPFIAHSIEEDDYLLEGELIFLKKFITETHQFCSKRSISLNIFVDVLPHFKNSPMYTMKRLWLYKGLLGMKASIKLNFKNPYNLKQLLNRNLSTDEKGKATRKKQLKLLRLLKQCKGLKNIAFNNQLLRLLGDIELVLNP